MPSFFALEHYNPAWVILLGVITFAAALGTGLLAAPNQRRRRPDGDGVV